MTPRSSRRSAVLCLSALIACAIVRPAAAQSDDLPALRQACQQALEDGLSVAEFDELAPRLRAWIAACPDGAARLSALRLAAELCWNIPPEPGADLRGFALGQLLALPNAPRARAMLVDQFVPPLHSAAPPDQPAALATFDATLDRLAAPALSDQQQADLLYLRCRVRVEVLRAWDASWLGDTARRPLDERLTLLRERFAAVASPTAGTYGELAADLQDELRDAAFGVSLADRNLEDIEGGTLRLGDRRGHVVVLSFWSSWCLPCLALAPDERAMHDRLAARGVRLIGVNSDETRAAAIQTAEKHGLDWPHIWSPRGAGPRDLPAALHIRQWPSIVILDADGRVRGKFVGSVFQGRWTIAAVEQAVLQILDNAAPAASQSAEAP